MFLIHAYSTLRTSHLLLTIPNNTTTPIPAIAKDPGSGVSATSTSHDVEA
jgi:hypothetical protein